MNRTLWEAYYLDLRFLVEKTPTKRVPWQSEKGGVNIYELCNYPMIAMVFEGGITLEDLYNSIGNSYIFLQDNNIPYNVLIVDCGKRVF